MAGTSALTSELEAAMQTEFAYEAANLPTAFNSFHRLAYCIASPGTSTGIEERLIALEGRATALEGRATALEGRATVLETQVADLEVRVARLESIIGY